MEKTLSENQQTIPCFKKSSDTNENDRYYLSCVDDDNTPTCFMCRKSFSNMKSLFDHMTRHSDYHWRKILPLKPEKSVIIVRRKLLSSSSSTSDLSESGSPKSNNDEAGCSRGAEAVDLKNFLPVVKKTGKRGRPATVGCRKDDGAAAEGGRKVVFQFDLNEKPQMMD